jgi:hypothetical protein
MSLFNKIQNGAHKLYTKFNSNGGIFDKINTGLRKGDNTVQRIGHFIRPLADHFGVGGLVQNVMDKVHGYKIAGTNNINAIKNNLEKSVNAPMSEIMDSNYK